MKLQRGTHRSVIVEHGRWRVRVFLGSLQWRAGWHRQAPGAYDGALGPFVITALRRAAPPAGRQSGAAGC
jgi:hypothetical protein